MVADVHGPGTDSPNKVNSNDYDKKITGKGSQNVEMADQTGPTALEAHPKTFRLCELRSSLCFLINWNGLSVIHN
jgi:hypothetical protein